MPNNIDNTKKDVFVEMDFGGGGHDATDERRRNLGTGSIAVNGPAILCDLINTFENSPALDSDGAEAGIVLRFINNNGEVEDITGPTATDSRDAPGDHLADISVWTDKTMSVFDDFNANKLRFLGGPSLRPALSGTIVIGDGNGAGTTAEDSITITGLTIDSPPCTGADVTNNACTVDERNCYSIR